MQICRICLLHPAFNFSLLAPCGCILHSRRCLGIAECTHSLKSTQLFFPRPLKQVCKISDLSLMLASQALWHTLCEPFRTSAYTSDSPQPFFRQESWQQAERHWHKQHKLKEGEDAPWQPISILTRIERHLYPRGLRASILPSSQG